MARYLTFHMRMTPDERHILRQKQLLAAEVAGEWDIEEIDAAALTVAQLRDIERGLAFRGMSATGGRAVIINESHGLKRDVIRQLLVSLERIPSHVVWVFTT